MKPKSLKKQANNEKSCLIKGKTAKNAADFMLNKANYKNIEIGVSLFKTSKYEIFPAWRSKKQSQFKPNTNPIPERQKINLNPYNTMKYKDLYCWRVEKTKPIQSQFLLGLSNLFKPNLSQNKVFSRATRGPQFLSLGIYENFEIFLEFCCIIVHIVSYCYISMKGVEYAINVNR